MSGASDSETTEHTTLFVDTHVHIYDCFDLGRLLDSAVDNFARAANARGIERFRGVLMLAETAADHAYRRLAGLVSRDGATAPGWRFAPTAEPEALHARRGDGSELLIVAGRQIVTREKLEILALGTIATFADGHSIEESLSEIRAAGGLAILPWGVGKWWGSRGALMDDVLRQTDHRDVLLGDNSGRPWFFPLPKQFRDAGSRGRRILPGSDPLPFAREAGRAGSVGMIVRAALPETSPATAIKELLRDESTRMTPYMRLERLVPFVRNQVGMQLRKRAG
jgi:hypothetical protein